MRFAPSPHPHPRQVLRCRLMMALFEDYPASALGLETGVSLLRVLCSAEDVAKDGGAAAVVAHNDGDHDALGLTREDRDGMCDLVQHWFTRAQPLQQSWR